MIYLTVSIMGDDVEQIFRIRIIIIRIIRIGIRIMSIVILIFFKFLTNN